MQYPQVIRMYHIQNSVLLRFKVCHIRSIFVNTEKKNRLGVGGVRGIVLRWFFFVLPGANLALID